MLTPVAGRISSTVKRTLKTGVSKRLIAQGVSTRTALTTDILKQGSEARVAGVETAFKVAKQASEFKSQVEAIGGTMLKTHLGGFSEHQPTHPLFIKGIQASVGQLAGYSSGTGLPVVKQLYSTYINAVVKKKEEDSPFSEGNVLMISDAKAGIDGFLSSINPEESRREKWVMIPEVGYPNYYNLAKAKGFGIMSIPIKTNSKGVAIGLDLSQVRREGKYYGTVSSWLTRARGVIFNSGPQNPLGVDFSEQIPELAGYINEANRDRISAGVFPVQVLDDLAYLDITTKKAPYQVLSTEVPYSLMLLSFSKAFRAPAARGGALISRNEKMLGWIGGYMSNKTIPNLPAQYGAIEVLKEVTSEIKKGNLDSLASFHASLTPVRKAIISELSKLESLGIYVNRDQDSGVFVCVYLDPKRYEVSEFQQRLMRMGVPVTTQAHFGDPKNLNFLRVAIAGNSKEELVEGVKRIKYVAEQYRQWSDKSPNVYFKEILY